MAATNDLATDQPEVVAVAIEGGFGYPTLQQVEQEGRERGDDGGAGSEVRRFALPTLAAIRPDRGMRSTTTPRPPMGQSLVDSLPFACSCCSPACSMPAIIVPDLSTLRARLTPPRKTIEDEDAATF